MNPKPFVTLLILLAPVFSFCQNKYFEKGFVIKPGGDTVSGYLEKLTDESLSKKVRFKKDINESSSIETFYPSDIAGFYFEKFDLKFEPVEFSVPFEDTLLTGKRFAVLMLSGYSNLYKLEMAEKLPHLIFERNNTFVYVVKKAHSWHTLSESEELKDNQHRLVKEYIPQLREVVTDCASFDLTKAEDILFFDAPFIKLIKAYNNCMQPSAASTLHTSKSPLQIMQGVNASYVFYKAKNVVSGNGFSFGYFIDILNPDANKKFSGTIGINYMHFNYNYKFQLSDIKDTVIHQKNTIIRVPLFATFRLADGKTIPFVNIGGSFYHSFTDKLSHFYISAGSGCFINKRVLVSATVDNFPGLFSGTKEKFISFTAGFIF